MEGAGRDLCIMCDVWVGKLVIRAAFVMLEDVLGKLVWEGVAF